MNVEQVRALLMKVEDRSGKDVLATGLVQNLSVGADEIRMELVYDSGAYGMNDRGRIESSIKTALSVGGWEKKLTIVPIVKSEPVKSQFADAPKGGDVGGLVGIGKKGPQPPPHSHGPQGPPRGGPQQRPAPQGKKEIPGVKNVVAVASGKGGVGKSTVASNLAVALAKLGKKTGLLDNDVYGPSLPILFAVHEQPKVSDDRKLIPIEKYGVKLMSLGFVMDEG